ncbi:hypothetical protein HDU76_000691 [Blyttiomyces sp. JEL0837]|nr:hypothetical protein HDU76_000691 [Blyttiomyces sp. JEL0837]
MVLKDILPNQSTVAQLKEKVRETIKSDPKFRPYVNNSFDTLKLYMKAHGAKTQNLIINLDHEDWFLEDEKLLSDCGIENETEISFFNRTMYDEYKAHPETKW